MSTEINGKTILALIFEIIGDNPGDAKLAECADACAVANISLLAAIHDDKIRDRAIAKCDEQTADCIRRSNEILDAIDDGELDVETPH